MSDKMSDLSVYDTQFLQNAYLNGMRFVVVYLPNNSIDSITSNRNDAINIVKSKGDYFRFYLIPEIINGESSE